MSTVLFALHLVAALTIISVGLRVMEHADLLDSKKPWAQRMDDSALCFAWLCLGVGAFISLLAYVFDMKGLGGVDALANPMILTGAALLAIIETYCTGKT